MAMFHKMGVNKAKGEYIYPEFTQTGTGNCSAYAGAACLYAFAKDHEPGLLPPVDGGTPGEQFQVQSQRTVEQLTDLIYTQGYSVANGYRQYLKSREMSDKFEVTEITGGSYTLPDGNSRPNWEFIKAELQRCQDVMVHIKYSGGTCKPWNRHAVTLVGFDVEDQKALVMNPWGAGTTNVPPKEAGENTAAGKTERAHTAYDFSVSGDTVTVEFEGNTATVYQYVKICPADAKVAYVDSREGGVRIGKRETQGARYAYTLTNKAMHGVTALAIGIPTLRPQDVAGLLAPPGWSAALWYRENDPHFDLLAPEVLMQPARDPRPIGVLFRSEKPIPVGATVKGFAVDLFEPGMDSEPLHRLEDELGRQSPTFAKALVQARRLFAKSRKWQCVPGQAVVVAEYPRGTHAVHLDAMVPKRVCDAMDRALLFIHEQGLI